MRKEEEALCVYKSDMYSQCRPSGVCEPAAVIAQFVFTSSCYYVYSVEKQTVISVNSVFSCSRLQVVNCFLIVRSSSLDYIYIHVYTTVYTFQWSDNDQPRYGSQGGHLGQPGALPAHAHVQR